MKLKAWPIVSDAVERGVSYGYRRAYKYTETPSEDDIREAIEQGVMSELAEIINFDEEDVECKPTQ